MDKVEFLKAIAAIDQALGDEGVPVFQRQFPAWFRLARNYSGPIQGSGIDYSLYAEYEGPNLFRKIGEWYKACYGAQFNMPTVVGRVPLLLRGHVYPIRIPFIIGKARLENLPTVDVGEGLIKSLTTEEVSSLEETYKEGYVVSYEVDDFRVTCMDHDDGVVKSAGLNEVFERAIADRETALICLVDRPPDPSNASYHSQQYAEKMLKGFLLLRRQATDDADLRKRFVHDLEAIFKSCINSSAAFVDINSEIVALKSIKPSIRYGGAVSVPAAIEAVWASLRVGSFVARQISGLPSRQQALANEGQYWVAVGRLFRKI